MRDGPLLAANWLLFAALILACARACAEGWTIRPVVEERADAIEWNSVYDWRGRHVFDQIIVRRWCARDCYHHCEAWRLVKEHMLLFEDAVVWLDGKVLRIVKGPLRRTHTQHDPELSERRTHRKQSDRAELTAYHWR